MIILAIGSMTAAYGATLANQLGWIGHVVAALGYLLIGVGSGAAGTSLLVLLSKQVSDQRNLRRLFGVVHDDHGLRSHWWYYRPTVRSILGSKTPDCGLWHSGNSPRSHLHCHHWD